MFSKILLCSDGSPGAMTAVRMGAQIAQKFHSTTLLLHSHDPANALYPAVGSRGWEFVAGSQKFDFDYEETQRDVTEQSGKILREGGLKYETVLECRHPVEAITSVAKQDAADLIVMGGRGTSVVPSFLLGSVSEGVLHHAHCPVLIVRGDASAPLQRILLASDGSEDACQATAIAIAMAHNFGASLRVLNVLDASSLSSSLSPYPCSDSDTPYARAERLLAEITAKVSAAAVGTGITCSFHQETGNPADLIVAFADLQETDLIVLGCRGRGALASLLLGSVSNSVAHNAYCSVLVTR
jgi:nucleotide-binding universal stress UspA family protein